MNHRSHLLVFSAVLLASTFATAQEGVTRPDPAGMPSEIGAVVQGGNGLTEDRDSFHFLMAGVHAGKVLTGDHGPGPLRGSFEYAVEFFPFWQSYTPTFERARCSGIGSNPGTPSNPIACSPLYTVGGTYTGLSVTPIILRWNFAGGGRLMPWIQGAGGVVWTNHKYPAFGSAVLNLNNDGPNADTSVWNFTPQAGVGLHYFVSRTRSIDFGVNAIHISSASLGDRNPGVNASLQANIGYSWWK